jgi:hypothetical protein
MAAVKKKAPSKQPVKPKAKQPKPSASKGAAASPAPKKPRVFAIPFASVYPLYIQKAENKGRTKAEVDAVIAWLTGYRGAALQRTLDAKIDVETFVTRAPRWNPNATLITGVVCGIRVEDITDPLMQKLRYLDKLVDELARGKKLDSILRK